MTIEEIKQKISKIHNERYGGGAIPGQVYAEIPFPDFDDVNVWRPEQPLSIWRPSKNRIEFLLNSIGDVKGKKILDLGCSCGTFSFELSKRGAIVTGVDIDADLVEIDNDIAKYYNQTASFVAADLTNEYLKSITEHYDYIICFSILNQMLSQNSKLSVRVFFRELERIGDVTYFEMGGHSEWGEDPQDKKIDKLLNDYSNFTFNRVGFDNHYRRITYRCDQPKLSDFTNYWKGVDFEGSNLILEPRPNLLVFKKKKDYFSDQYIEVMNILKNNWNDNIMRVYGTDNSETNPSVLIENIPGLRINNIDWGIKKVQVIQNIQNILSYCRKHNLIYRDEFTINLLYNEVINEFVLIDWAETAVLPNPCKPCLTNSLMEIVSPMKIEFNEYMARLFLNELSNKE